VTETAGRILVPFGVPRNLRLTKSPSASRDGKREEGITDVIGPSSPANGITFAGASPFLSAAGPSEVGREDRLDDLS